MDIIVEIVKKESKTLNTFQKLLEWISQSPQYNRSRQEVRLYSTKHSIKTLINELNRDQQSVHNWETSQKKAFCIIAYSYSILSILIDIIKMFCILHNKVALLTRDGSDWKIPFCHGRRSDRLNCYFLKNKKCLSVDLYRG